MHLIAFVVALGALIGGMVVMGYAEHFPGFESVVFIVGLMMAVGSLFIPAHIMKWIDG